MVLSPRRPPQVQDNPNNDQVPPDFYKNELIVRHRAVGNRDNVPSTDLLSDIREVRIEESLYEPCRFTLVIDNPYGPGSDLDEPGKYTDKFIPGDDWQFLFKTSRSEYPAFTPNFEGRLFAGKSFKVTIDFDKEAQGRIVISGYDELALFAEGTRNRTFLNRSHQDIVTTIAKEVGITIREGSIEDTGVVEEYICQADETNLQFLSKIAAMTGFELFVQCEDDGGEANGILYFRKPREEAAVKMSLEWGENVRSIKPRNKKFQYNFVDMPYWKYEEKRLDGVFRVPRNSGEAQTDTGVPEIDTTVKGSTFIGSGAWNMYTLQKCEEMAQSTCDQYEGQLLCAEIELEGNADVRAGERIQITSKDPKSDLRYFEGFYYVTDTCHIYEQGRFKTKITISETGGYSVFQHIFSPVEHLRPGQTHLVGIVTNNKDNAGPPDMGCVKVRFPTLRSTNAPEGIESDWARVVTLGAGNERGIDWLPEVGDEVVVAFENGDIHRPYIIGSVWNGVDKSPEKHDLRVNSNGVRLRTLKTRVGHEIEFVEEDDRRDGKERGIYIKTADQFRVELNDSKQEILVTTPNGMKMQLSDATNNIYIEAGPGGGRILLDSTGVHINSLL
jgi:phage protein D